MDKKATRDGFGEGLLELGATKANVVALSGDLGDSTRAEWFMEKYPDRFFECGIAEQDMVGTAVGLALGGKIPFACSFSCFLTTRAYDQIRVSVCYNDANVKLVGTHAGITTGPDGATAQALEDIACMRVLPNMSVVVPCDAIEARKAAIAAADYPKPLYLRLGRGKTTIITAESDDFTLGTAVCLREGKDVAILACGIMVKQALDAADILDQDGLAARIINIHTVKPIDMQAIIEAARDCGAIVTAEEHNVQAGFGAAVAEIVVGNHPVPMEMIGMASHWGESGEAEELLAKYHMTAPDIAEAAKRCIARKGACI